MRSVFVSSALLGLAAAVPAPQAIDYAGVSNPSSSAKAVQGRNQLVFFPHTPDLLHTDHR